MEGLLSLIARVGLARWLRGTLAVLVLWCQVGSPNCQAKTPGAAELKISGYGVLGDIKLRKTLRLLEISGKKPEFFESNFVEDGALILISRLNQDGFLKPRLTALLTLEDGRQLSFEWQQAVREESLPRPLRIRKVHFQIHKGILYYFDRVEFTGLSTISEDQARAYFVDTTPLLPLKSIRVYSPDRLERGLSSLSEVLNRQGYEGAEAKAAKLDLDDRTGKVEVRIDIHLGLKSMVRSIREEFYYQGSTQAERVITIQTNTPFSKLWLQDFVQELRATNYHQGYPDTTVETSQMNRENKAGSIQIDLLARVRGGQQVWLGKVKFTGEKATRPSVMERRVRLSEGSLLDRILIEEGRYRLSQLGVFDTVGLKYETVDEHERNVVYDVKEGKTIDVSLLFGWGSYELLRGGVEVDQNNLFGLAHHARLLLTQSFKASYGEYVYTIPELIGRDVDVFFNGSALRREEISFTREEYGGGFGARKFVKPIASDVTVRYSYQVLNATLPGLPFEEGLPSAGVGSVITEIRHDHVDNVLYPRKGYRLFGNLEVASDYLGGEANFQRLELGGSLHQPLDKGRWLHLGIRHGAIFPLGSTGQDLPFNRRFFPGGEDSIRGYQEGEAAPRDARGNVIGAESYLFGSVELEQALTTSWSLVGFLDTVSFAQHIRDYPFNQTLFSVGGGLSWKTIIGPVRLEYGYNLNPRPHDPSGTIQFSVGFPF